METIKNYLWYLLFLLITSYGCQKEHRKEVKLDDQQLEAKSSNEGAALNSVNTLAWFPDGSTTRISERSLYVKAPKDWSYVGYDKSNNLLDIPSEVMTTISCTCNTNGECGPFKASGPGGSISGCAGDCTNCTMLQSVSIDRVSNPVLIGGYYNKNLKTRLLKNGESTPAVFDALFEVKEFQKELKNLYDKAYRGRPFVKAIHNEDGSVTAPDGFSLVGASVMGRGLLVVLPVDYVKEQLGHNVLISASCSCTEGGCGLKDKSVLGVGAIWCDGKCKGTCSLTTKFLDSRYHLTLEFISFKY